jgi:SAM-dependent methyltransferase
MSLRHWENYYRGGALTSCPVGGGIGYTKELKDVWVKFFSGFPDGARILDVGTGNGAVALIARQAAEAAGKHYEIHGTDLAQIDPIRYVKDGERLFAGIRFHPMVATEHLPFEASSFEAVSGQYALEYTAIDRALRDIYRVLKSGGLAQFILHHAESIVTRNALESLSQSALVLEESKILRKLRRHLEAERRTGSAARRTWDDLGAALELLERAAARSHNPLTLRITIDAVGKLLATGRQLSAAALDREIDRFETDFRAAVRRLEDLVRCGQSGTDMQRIVELAVAGGFGLLEMAVQLHAGEQLVGWRLRLAKP